jgi:hypothetical protein
MANSGKRFIVRRRQIDRLPGSHYNGTLRANTDVVSCGVFARFPR